MNRAIYLFCVWLCFGLVPAAAQTGEWQVLFNGKDLTGWRANLDPAAFTVKDGVLRIQSSSETRAHLFYVGDRVHGLEKFKNFELEATVRAEPDSNGGIFVHTDMSVRDKAQHLAKGYEVQLNSAIKEKRKTGSLYAIVDFDQSPVDETKWFTVRVVVIDKRITVALNGQQLVDYTEPPDVQRPPERAGRLFANSGGAIALQAHDAKSVWYFKDLRVKRLPDSTAANPSRWEKEIAAFEEADRKAAPPKGGVLFTGASGIRRWETLRADFPNYQVINRGFGGSGLSDVVHFTDRIVVPYAPKLIILYPGGNDIHQGKSPRQVAEDFKSFVRVVHAKLPQTRIAFISLAPNPARFSDADDLKEANRLIAAYAAGQKQVDFIDLYPQMLSSSGGPRPELFIDDRLHMNADGYKLWAEIVNEYLRSRVQGERKMHGLIGKMMAVPGQRDALIAILLEGVAGMPGCLSYVVAKDPADANAIWITEVWESEQSHRASLSLPAVRQAIARGKPLIAGFGDYTVTEPVGGHGLSSNKIQ